MELNQKRQFIVFATLFYLLFFAAGSIWYYLAGNGWVFGFNPNKHNWVLEIAIAAACLGFYALFAFGGVKYVREIRNFLQELKRFIGTFTVKESFLLALVSAIGEEALFRGAMQSSFGFWITAVIFGITHFPPTKKLRIWPVYAFAIGLFFGALTEISGDILLPVILHFFINFFSFLYLHYRSETFIEHR